MQNFLLKTLHHLADKIVICSISLIFEAANAAEGVAGDMFRRKKVKGLQPSPFLFLPTILVNYFC